MLQATFDFSSAPAQSRNWPNWWRLVEDENLQHIRAISWPTTVKPELMTQFPGIEVLGSVVSADSVFNFMFWLDGVLVMLWFGRKEVTITMAAKKPEDFKVVEEKFRAIYPELVRQKGEEVRIEFWFCAPNGQGNQINRMLAVPRWEEIKNNYGKEVQDEMNRLTTNFTPSHGGQLIIWQGPPGTGKTFAIRSLCREWVKWCDAAYVIDPEVFFGNANYMMSVILESGEEDYNLTNEDEEDKQPRYKLIILEDCGELLSQDAKLRTGQALSRLLNVADGLIGQGLNAMILITTNEDMESLHEAVRRPGRCASKLIFPNLTADEANAWMKEHNIAEETTGPMSLAELYGKVEGFATQAEPGKENIGFYVAPQPKGDGKRRMGFFTGREEEPLTEEHGEQLGKMIPEEA